MPESPWQHINCSSVLFIIDAAHRVEESVLRDWLVRTQEEVKFQGQVHTVLVPIVEDPENIPTDDLAAALELPADAMIAPVRVMWRNGLDELSSKPRFRDLLSGNPRRPGVGKARRIIAADPAAAVCVMGLPATLENLQQRFSQRQEIALVDKNLADYIAGQASLALEVAQRRLRGSRYKVPRQVSKQIRASDRYKRGIVAVAELKGESERDMREKALPIFKELVSVPKNFWQDVMASFNRKIISVAYAEKLVIDQMKLERYRQIVREHPTALLWTHKTHMDGLAMQNVLFENDFPTPHVIGGINMAFAGLGFLARRSGAIFIRRSFQDNPLYKLVLRSYLSYLLEKRFPLTWAFEGTRSRVGKLMPPRYGILKYVMEAISDSSADELYILPVAINYDMINDVKDYAAEQAGGIKRPESLSWAISYVRRMRHPLGRIYVDFGEPVVIRRDEISDDGLALKKTAFRVGVEVNRVTPITLTSLMSMSLLAAAPRAQTIEELRNGLTALRDWTEHRNISLTSDFAENRETQVAELVDAMVKNELINRYDEGPETVYAVADDQHMIASYYRNTIVHHFVIKAIAELALVHAISTKESKVKAFWREADELRDMFKFEFFYSPTEQFNQEVRDEFSYFDSNWEMQLESDPEFGAAFLRELKPLVAHGSLRPYIEAYRIVCDVFARLDANQTMELKAAVSESFKYGRQAYLQRRISSKASMGKILFQNGYKLLDSYDLVAADGDNVVQRRKQLSKRLRLLSHRLAQLRSLAMPAEF